MDSKAQLVKTIVKRAEPKPEFGKDPRDPWSVRANIPEEALNEWQQSAILMRYLKSKGIDPRYVTKDTMISHSKSGEFDKWKRDHADLTETMTVQHSPTQMSLHRLKKSVHMHKEIPSDGIRKEEVDKKDTVTLDIPLLIRVLELAREDLKSDPDLHKVVEKLINIRNKGVLTMDDYENIAKIEEQVIQAYVEQCGCDSKKMDPKEWTKVAQARSEKWRRKQIKVDEDKFQDSYAATQTVGSEISDDVKQKERSKSARMIKALYKKHRVSEETYDHEKEDKSVATYGKKPKMQKVDGVDNLGENKPKAAAILSGGKTMTGQTRDTVEIDPMMRGRPDQKPEKKV